MTSAALSGTEFEAVITFLRPMAENEPGVLTKEDLEQVEEVIRRLEKLRQTYLRLLEINSALSEQIQMSQVFDPITETVSIKLGDQVIQSFKLNRAHPDQAITPGNSAILGAYASGSRLPEDSQYSIDLKIEMEDLLELFYYSAHRVLKLVQSMSGQKNFKCRSITIVRNKLVEHADHTTRYSCGFGTNGPTVRPLGSASRSWADAGLIPNTTEFLLALRNAFSPAAPREA